MEKEQIISTLTGKLGTTQLSSRTISTYVENNLLEEGSEYNDDYFTKHVNILKSLQGQFSADVANQVNTFKSEWEKNHPKADPKPTDPPTPPQPNDDMAKMLARMEALENELKESKNKNAQQALRNTIKAKSGELKVSNKYLWDKVSNETTITENMTAEQLLEAVKNAYESELQNIIGNGATPYGTGSTPNPEETKKGLDDYFAKKKAQGKF